MKSRATCLLCHRNPPIENSHILPKLIVTAISKQLEDRGFREMSSMKLRVERTLVGPFFCLCCEKKFGRFEDDFTRIYLDPYFDNDQITIESQSLLLLFAMSVLWRVLAYTLTQDSYSDKFPYLLQAEERWRGYLEGKNKDVGAHKCYLVLDREFTKDQIQSSAHLTRIDLRYGIAQGITFTQIWGALALSRHVVYAKLGPFLFIGELKEFFEGQTDHLLEPWHDLTSTEPFCLLHDPAASAPKDIVAMADRIFSQWQWRDDYMKPERRNKLQATLSALSEDSQFKRLLKEDMAMFNSSPTNE
ncbi:hypothetical protein ACIPEN_08470 [Herbaspirillum chlorophenolicum]|uniref:Uncharacterized protein n=1 Tax=Herbaspirillum chlorophenolicum TaxID=211589 RepID=A0ABW8EY68_9BURK